MGTEVQCGCGSTLSVGRYSVGVMIQRGHKDTVWVRGYQSDVQGKGKLSILKFKV